MPHRPHIWPLVFTTIGYCGHTRGRLDQHPRPSSRQVLRAHRQDFDLLWRFSQDLHLAVEMIVPRTAPDRTGLLPKSLSRKTEALIGRLGKRVTMLYPCGVSIKGPMSVLRTDRAIGLNALHAKQLGVGFRRGKHSSLPAPRARGQVGPALSTLQRIALYENWFHKYVPSAILGDTFPLGYLLWWGIR